MKKITYVCDVCALHVKEEEELVGLDDASGQTLVADYTFVVTAKDHRDYALIVEVSIRNESRSEFHLCKECIIGKLENIIQVLRKKE